MKKRVLIFFLAIGITAVSSVSMAAMSNSAFVRRLVSLPTRWPMN